MYNNLLNYCFPTSSDISTTTTPVNPSFDTRIDIEYQEFLPEVYDTWSFIHKLSTDTARFREIYDLYKYERSETEQKSYFNQLKILDDTIYKLSLTIHQRLQYLEKIVQPTLEQFHSNQQNNNNYTPAYIRIAQNQLNSLKFSFQRIITKHNSDSIDYQNDLKQSVENSKEIINSYEQIPSTTTNKIQTLLDANEEKNHLSQIQLQIQQQDLTEQEQQIVDLETRLDSLRILKERVRQMNEMTMALYFSVREQNDLTDNIWLNTSAGSDYIAQSVDEFRLVKDLKQSKMNLYIKLASIAFCFLLILIIILILISLLD